jgi:hypothetical protein
MAAQWIDNATSENPLSAAGPEKGYCPECGQSLDLSGRLHVATGRGAARRWLLAIVGICLAVLFGVRTWHARDALAGLDRQIEDRRDVTMHDVFGTPSNQEMLRDEMVSPLLADRVSLQQSFDRAATGLMLGFLAIATSIAAGPPVRPSWNLAPGSRRRSEELHGRRSSRGSPVLVAIRLGAVGDYLVGSLFGTLLVVFGGSVVASVVQGVPASPELIEQALTRTVDVVAAVGGMIAGG